MTKETDLAYLAGLMDGEAYIGIKKSAAYECQQRKTPGYHARIQVRMVHEPAIRFLADTFGGHFYQEKAHCNNGRPLYCWAVSDKLTETILRQVLPYLRVKKDVCEVVLSLRDLQSTRSLHKTKVIGERNFPNRHGTSRRIAITCFSDEYVAMCESLWLRCKELNRVGGEVIQQ